MLHWRQLTELPERELGRRDIAEVNLACAMGLPGTECITLRACLDSLDACAGLVRHYTDLALEQFFRADPGKFKNSEPFFRAVCLITALQRHCGVRYNPDKIPEDAPFGPEDTFLHGIIHGNGGTCASMPVMYAAVGRRLGYPIKLAHAQGKVWGHRFARWDEPDGDRFNIEATASGLSSPSDDYYRTGLYAVSADHERRGHLLRSLTPTEELAAFLADRSNCWRDLGGFRRAVDARARAYALVPSNAYHRNVLNKLMNDWIDDLDRVQPPGFPEMYIRTSKRRFPATLPLEIERQILGREATENLLNDPEQNELWWEPMRRGLKPRPTVTRAEVRFEGDTCTIGLHFTHAN
jgi:hypothetical protein